MNRRRFLQTLPTAGILSLAGCSSLLGPKGTVLGTITVVNYSQIPHDVHLYLLQEGERILTRDLSLAPIDAPTSRSVQVVDPGVRKRSKYSLRAYHLDDDGDRASNKWEYTFTHRDYKAYYGDDHRDPGCVAAMVRVGRGETERIPPIGIGPTDARNPCGET